MFTMLMKDKFQIHQQRHDLPRSELSFPPFEPCQQRAKVAVFFPDRTRWDPQWSEVDWRNAAFHTPSLITREESWIMMGRGRELFGSLLPMRWTVSILSARLLPASGNVDSHIRMDSALASSLSFSVTPCKRRFQRREYLSKSVRRCSQNPIFFSSVFNLVSTWLTLTLISFNSAHTKSTVFFQTFNL